MNEMKSNAKTLFAYTLSKSKQSPYKFKSTFKNCRLRTNIEPLYSDTANIR